MHAVLAMSALAVVFATSAIAQQKVTLQFLSFPKGESLEPVELVIGEGETLNVEIPSHELSPSYQVTPLGSIVVGRTVVNAEGEPSFETYGRANAINASHQIVLLLRKGRRDSDGFVVLPINGQLADFSGASFLFINVTTLNVGGVIGDKKFVLEPGKQKMLKPAPNHNEDICQVTLAYQHEDTWKTFYDTRWPSNKGYRSLVFFYQDPTTKRMNIAPVVDFLPH